MTSIADHTTVVGDRDFGSKIERDFGSKNSQTPSPSKAAGGFLHTADYTLEERPFFVPIGKDGLIGALQRLDQQLIAVSTYILSRARPFMTPV
jgi:hypothetical protein